ncbi:MAG: prepilin-type N-terminal cleavage/methylation domain-containing protein [Phycisphaerales bacterium]|nr:prepilin-type N-terminal cleavage/methylation domain-containing protein [Phycisphaerales bacterium]
MNRPLSRRNAAFTLIELVIVVVIIGILAAIAVPRMSRGAAAASDSALVGNLTQIRNALEMFQAEHGGTYPALAKVTDALTQYSDTTLTTVQDSKDESKGVIFGPYLRAVPPLPVGPHRGKTAFVAAIDGNGGWVYDDTKGIVKANVPNGNKDAMGKEYNAY